MTKETKLIVDEAHEFKNVPTQTKLTNVAGISSSASQKALDLFMKCRYLDEKTGGRGVIMATGTPLSNSVTELHTMMRFLEYDFLKDHGLANFDKVIAYITSELLEKARDGMSVTELMSEGRKILSTDDVMDGVAEMISEIQFEATFPDGTKLVTVHEPILPGSGIIPGEIITDEGEIIINAGKKSIEIIVENTADRPVQVGSHFHFFEVNKALRFDRKSAFGMRLDIPSGTAVRFEPGESKTVSLVEIGGRRIGCGLNNLTEGELDKDETREKAFEKAEKLCFKGV